MKYFSLENSKYKINLSKISFGAGVFDNYNKYSEYFKYLDYYFEMGGKVIDTARVYCDWLPEGKDTSEKIIGKWLKSRGIARDEVIIVTKCSHPPLDNMKKSRLSKEDIDTDITRSLELIGTDYVDILFLHRDNKNVAVSGIIDGLNDVMSKKMTKFIGASNWTGERIMEANYYANKSSQEGFSISQISYSLAITTPKECHDETLVCMNPAEHKFYSKNDFPVMAFASQAKGFFSKYQAMDELTQKINARFYSEQNVKRAEVVAKLAKEKGVSPATISIAYITSQKMPATAIIGMSSIDQLKDSLSATDLTLTNEEIKLLDI